MMNPDNHGPLLGALGDLDPAAEHPPPDAAALHARVLDRIESADTADIDAVLPLQRSRHTKRLALGAVGAVVLLLAGVIGVNTLGGDPAYAGWTRNPVNIDADTMAQHCPDRLPPWDIEDDDARDIPLEPVLAEQRGPYTFAVMLGDDPGHDPLGACLVSQRSDGIFSPLSATYIDIDHARDVADPVAVIDVIEGWGEEGGDGEFTAVIGTYASGVSDIEITDGAGDRVAASLNDGWWVAWYPGSEAPGGDVAVTVEGEPDQLSWADVDHSMPAGP